MTDIPTALDPTEVVIGLNNGPGLYKAPAGTPAPTDLDGAWPAPWVPIGYISDDGVTVSGSTDSDTITPWQSTSPIRTVITGKSYTMQFVMWQLNADTLALYFDMDVPTTDADGGFSFDVRSDGGGELYAVGVDIKDGDLVTRISFGRPQLSDNGDVAIARGSAVGLDVTLSALDDAGVLAHITSGKVTAAPPEGLAVDADVDGDTVTATTQAA